MIDLVMQVNWPLEGLWSSTLGFVALFVSIMGLMGAASRHLSVAALAAAVPFVYIGSQVDVPLITNLMYVVMVVVFMGLAFKIIRSEAWGE